MLDGCALGAEGMAALLDALDGGRHPRSALRALSLAANVRAGFTASVLYGKTFTAFSAALQRLASAHGRAPLRKLHLQVAVWNGMEMETSRNVTASVLALLAGRGLE